MATATVTPSAPVVNPVKPDAAPVPDTASPIKSGATIRRIVREARSTLGRSTCVALTRALERDSSGAMDALLSLSELLSRGVDPSASITHPDDPTRTMPALAFLDGSLRAGKGAAKSQVDRADSILSE